MTPTKDQQAQEYAEKFPPIPDDDIAYAIGCAWLDGYTAAEQSMWRSVEERLPEDDRYFYFVADARLDPLGVDCAEYTCETKLFSRNGKILHPTHWMPIPQLNPETQSI